MAQSARAAQDFRGDAPFDKVFREFEGINTQAFRGSIQDGQFSWLENVIPIGFGNAKAVPACGETLSTIADTPSQAPWHATVSAIHEAMYTATTNGALYQTLLIAPFTTTKIANAGTLTGDGTSWAAQWKAERVLFIDKKGYFSWDGTTLLANGNAAFIDFTNHTSPFSGGTGYVVNDTINLTLGTGTGATAKVTSVSGGAIQSATILNPGSGYPLLWAATVTGGSGTGAKLWVQPMAGPTAGTSIAVFAGRVWIAFGRIVTYSAPDAYADFTVGSAGGQFVMTDPTLHDEIQALLSANNYLYIVGKTSYDALSNVTVNSSGGTPITNFTRINVEASIGSAIPASIFAHYRDILFANETGIYQLRGSTPEKISDDLDGILPLIDFTKPFSGGQVNIYNILCAAFNFTYNDAEGPRQLQALYFRKKWFLTSQGDIDFVCAANVGTLQNLYGLLGNFVVQMYANPNANIDQVFQTKLWDLGNPIPSKDTNRFGFLCEAPLGATADVAVSVDSEVNSVVYTLRGAKILQFVNNNGVPLNFVGTSPIVWVTKGLISMFSDIVQSGTYIGITLRSAQNALKYIAVEFDYFKRTRWGASK